jgi:hypothetical protein
VAKVVDAGGVVVGGGGVDVVVVVAVLVVAAAIVEIGGAVTVGGEIGAGCTDSVPSVALLHPATIRARTSNP